MKTTILWMLMVATTVMACARECPAISPSYHGQVTCFHRFVEGSQCTVTCEEGYRLSGNNTLTCLASGTWNAPLPTCEDVEPPKFPNGCPGNIEGAERFGDPTLIKSNNPVVTDNSGQTVLLTSNVPSNSPFQIGVTSVTYTATDVTGNKRSCEFKVTISTLQCSAPDFEPANRTQTLMTYTCPSGLVYGATCTLGCSQGYPLVGPGSITCERDDSTYPPTTFWDWPGHSANKPKCSQTVCPDLYPASHGTLACNLGNFGWDSLMSCQNDWDVLTILTTSDHFEYLLVWFLFAVYLASVKLAHFDL